MSSPGWGGLLGNPDSSLFYVPAEDGPLRRGDSRPVKPGRRTLSVSIEIRARQARVPVVHDAGEFYRCSEVERQS